MAIQTTTTVFKKFKHILNNFKTTFQQLATTRYQNGFNI